MYASVPVPVRLKKWLFRGSITVASVGLLIAGGCSDDDPAAAGADAGPEIFVQPPQPFDGGSPPPEGVDTTGRLGAPTVVTDVGRPIDGPSWNAIDHTLYFTVPSTTPTLRRLSEDGGIDAVDGFDSGPPGPYGTASGGGTTLYVTEPNALAILTPSPTSDAGGTAGFTVTRRTATFELLGDITAEERPDASTLAFFVDTGGARAWQFDPTGGANELTSLLDFDAGRATAIAVGKSRKNPSRHAIYVGVGNGASGTVQIVEDNDGQLLDGGAQVVVQSIQLPGTSPNGIAVDTQGNLLVAWARGIDMYSQSGDRYGSSPGLALAAAPTSLAFGSGDRKTLYVTTSAGKLYAVPTSIAGILR
jgi:hypothetical protein